jgi:DNA modification methylase
MGVMQEETVGDCRMVCGDARHLLPTVADGSIEMVWTDPPYGHGNMQDDLQAARVRGGVKGARRKAAEPIANDAGPEFRETMDAVLDELARVLNRDCCCCCGGGGPTPMFAWVADRLDRGGLRFFHAVVWDKSARGDGMGWRYRRNYEFVMVAHRKGGTLRWNEDVAAMPNVVRHAPVRERVHPNEKPLALVRQFILAHTQPGDTVLDPFAGSFTTAVACVQTGRKFVGCELDAAHYETGLGRVREAVGVGTLFGEAPEPATLFAESP